MPDKNILIAADGSPSELLARVTRGKKVSFIPTDSDQTVTVRFAGTGSPFSDWSSSSKTGTPGDPLTGKVRPDAEGRFPYQATSVDPTGHSQPESSPIANPPLIVDGGR